MNADDLYVLAGEYVLGTLSAARRADVETRMANDAALRTAVEQWQQKLARSVQIGRASNGGQPRRDVNTVSEPDSHIPRGFRG